jgi:hypothetical protein
MYKYARLYCILKKKLYPNRNPLCTDQKNERESTPRTAQKQHRRSTSLDHPVHDARVNRYRTAQPGPKEAGRFTCDARAGAQVVRQKGRDELRGREWSVGGMGGMEEDEDTCYVARRVRGPGVRWCPALGAN